MARRKQVAFHVGKWYAQRARNDIFSFFYVVRTTRCQMTMYHFDQHAGLETTGTKLRAAHLRVWKKDYRRHTDHYGTKWECEQFPPVFITSLYGRGAEGLLECVKKQLLPIAPKPNFYAMQWSGIEDVII